MLCSLNLVYKGSPTLSQERAQSKFSSQILSVVPDMLQCLEGITYPLFVSPTPKRLPLGRANSKGKQAAFQRSHMQKSDIRYLHFTQET